MVLARSVWHPEQATMSGLVETAERSRERDPSSWVTSKVGSEIGSRTSRTCDGKHRRPQIQWENTVD